MIESPPLPESMDVVAEEAAMLREFLDYQRIVMIRKVAGLSEQDARKPMTASGLSVLGVIKHLVDVERWWFRRCFIGEDNVGTYSSADDPDADFRIEDGETVAQIVDAYKAEIDRANQIITGVPLAQVSAIPSGSLRRPVSLRWIMIHMIEETARHAGHADLMRETLDGSTGD